MGVWWVLLLWSSVFLESEGMQLLFFLFIFFPLSILFPIPACPIWTGAGPFGRASRSMWV